MCTMRRCTAMMREWQLAEMQRIVMLGVCCTTAVRSSTTASIPAPLVAARRSLHALSCLSPTPLRLKDVRRSDRGESRRLTFEERAERRSGKTKETKASREHVVQEAQLMANEDFPQQLEAVYAVTLEKANLCAMKVLNMAKCLELLEIDVAGGHKILLTSVSQVVKVSPTEIEISPNSASLLTPILLRVSRFDNTLQVTKEATKIKVRLQPITTARRDKAASELTTLITTFRQKIKQARTHAGRVVQESGVDDNIASELAESMDSTMNAFLQEHVDELEELSMQVMSMGVDESDDAIKHK